MEVDSEYGPIEKTFSKTSHIMDKRISERVSRSNIIPEICANHQDIVDSLPAFKSCVTYLDTETTEIGNQMKSLLLPFTGTAKAKKLAKQNAANMIGPICGALMAYADRTHNLELRTAANFTEASIFRLRDEEMPQTCYALLDLANQYLKNLADYGYTAAEISKASDAVAAFDAYSPKPLGNRSEGKAERKTLLNLGVMTPRQFSG
jgi:hypothetical protein